MRSEAYLSFNLCSCIGTMPLECDSASFDNWINWSIFDQWKKRRFWHFLGQSETPILNTSLFLTSLDFTSLRKTPRHTRTLTTAWQRICFANNFFCLVYHFFLLCFMGNLYRHKRFLFVSLPHFLFSPTNPSSNDSSTSAGLYSRYEERA